MLLNSPLLLILITVLLFIAYAILVLLRPPKKVLTQGIVVLGIVTLLNVLARVVGFFGPTATYWNPAIGFTIFALIYIALVRSEVYERRWMTPVHRHVLAILVILLSVGLEAFLLLYFYSRDQWLVGLGLMLLVAGLSVCWLIRWYRDSLVGESIEAPKN